MSECCDCRAVTEALGEVNFEVRATEGGLALEVTPKDPARAGFLKDLARGAARLCVPAADASKCCAEGCC